MTRDRGGPRPPDRLRGPQRLRRIRRALGRCVYGGLYDEGSPLADAQGFRTDVLSLLRDFRMGVLRWPGGNFVSNYHWADGIGPKDERPRRPELAWGAEESNRFGTDEFMAYCRSSAPSPTCA